MSSKIQTPTNQKLLTNVALVRMKKAGVRFELACYPNKVKPWRNGIEKDLAEVLQIESVFTNVSKGQYANKTQLNKAFPRMSTDQIILEILKKGDLQVTQAERQNKSETMFRDIATIVAEKCVNSETKRPYTITVIEKAMKDIHFSVHPSRSAKQQDPMQALTVIATLKETIPIERAQMRLQISLPEKVATQIKDRLVAMLTTVEREEWGTVYEMTALMNPGAFRGVEDLIRSSSKGKGRIEVLEFSVIREGTAKIADEQKRTQATSSSSKVAKPQATDNDDDKNDNDDDHDDDDDDDTSPPSTTEAASPSAASNELFDVEIVQGSQPAPKRNNRKNRRRNRAKALQAEEESDDES